MLGHHAISEAAISALADVTSLQTVDGRARIQRTASQTQSGLSRVRVSVSRTQSGVARLTAAATGTQTGTARVTAAANRTQTGLGRAQRSVSESQSGVGRVRAVADRTQSGLSRVTVLTSRTQTGVSRITAGNARTQAGTARVRQQVLETQAGLGRLQITTNRTQPGTSRILREHYYSWAALNSLPDDDADLANIYSLAEIEDTETEDASYVDGQGQQQFLVHLFKDQATGLESSLGRNWIGRVTRPPASSPVYLQIYNYEDEAWETVDVEGSASSPISLSGILSENLPDYYNADTQTAWRVYQQVA